MKVRSGFVSQHKGSVANDVIEKSMLVGHILL